MTFKTVDSPGMISDPLIRKQREDVSKMRASLLACGDDPSSSVVAMKNITVLRVYHQIARVIRYLEMMDKIEDKLYQGIDTYLDNMNTDNMASWMMLINIQERLQKTMVESHRLLQPYLNVQEFNLQELTVGVSNNLDTPYSSLIPKSSRDKIRSAAQQVLATLDVPEDVE